MVVLARKIFVNFILNSILLHLVVEELYIVFFKSFENQMTHSETRHITESHQSVMVVGIVK